MQEIWQQILILTGWVIRKKNKIIYSLNLVDIIK